MCSKAYLILSALIFAVGAILHLLRITNGWVLQLGPIHPPLWASWVGLVVGAVLCVWGLGLVCCAKCGSPSSGNP